MAQIHESPINDTTDLVPSHLATTLLYVRDLDLDVNDSQIYDIFNQIGQFVYVRVCRDLASQQSLGYGYFNFSNPDDVAKAIDMSNFTLVNNKLIRIMYSHRDPSVRKSGASNICIKNLDKEIDHKALYDTFLEALNGCPDFDFGNSGYPDSRNSHPTYYGVLGSGPWDQVFGGGNSPAFVVAVVAALMSGLLDDKFGRFSIQQMGFFLVHGYSFFDGFRYALTFRF